MSDSESNSNSNSESESEELDYFDKLWFIKKVEFDDLIEKSVNKWIIEDEFEYYHMLGWGLTPRQKLHIKDNIVHGLTKLTNDAEWSDNTAYYVMWGIEGSINSMMKINIWEDFYNTYTSTQLADWIYKNLEYQLGDDEHSPCHLDWKCDEIKKRYLQRKEVCRIAVRYNIPSDLIPLIIAYAVPYSKIWDYMK